MLNKTKRFVSFLLGLGLLLQLLPSAAFAAETSSVELFLHADTPEAATVQAGASNVAFTKLSFIAGANMTLKGLAVTRGGTGASSDLSKLQLLDVQGTVLAEAAPAGNKTQLSFTYAMVSGQTYLLTLKGNVSAAAAAGDTIKLGVAASTDVTGVDSASGEDISVGGTFPLYGNFMTVGPAPQAASVGVALNSATPGIGVVQPGDQDVAFTKFSFTASGGNVLLKSLTLTRSGNTEDLGNVTLTDSAGATLGEGPLVPVPNDNDQVVFALNYPISVGATAVFTARADIKTGAPASHVDRLSIKSVSDVTAVNASSGGTATITGAFPVNGSYLTVGFGSKEVCTDGSDNDSDGYYDCHDADCTSDGACVLKDSQPTCCLYHTSKKASYASNFSLSTMCIGAGRFPVLNETVCKAMSNKVGYSYQGAEVVPTVPTTDTSCTDSDNGIYYNVKGVTKGSDEVTSVIASYTDSCSNAVGQQGASSGAWIAEKHCSSVGKTTPYVHTQWYKCPYGCSNGACSAAQSPVTTTQCTDSDNGLDSYVKGITYGPAEGTLIVGNYADSCSNVVGEQGFASGKWVVEKHCSSVGSNTPYVHTQWNECSNGCSNGACLKANATPTTPTTGSSVTFEVATNDYPDHHDYNLSKNIPYAYINVYNVTPVMSGVYNGYLRETISTEAAATAKVNVAFGEIVNFVGFKNEANAKANKTWAFSTPPYKNFGVSDQLCQTNYLETDKYLKNDQNYACASSLSTLYQDVGADVTVPAPIPTPVIDNVLDVPTCRDSDGGNNEFQKGELKVYTPKYGNNVIYEYCTNENGDNLYMGTHVEELVCLTGDPNYAYTHKRIKCKNGCRDGVCVSENETPAAVADERCDDCDGLWKAARERADSLNPLLKKVDDLRASLHGLYRKLYLLKGSVSLKEVLENAGAKVDENCKASEVSSDSETLSEFQKKVIGLPYVIGNIKFCIPDTATADSFVENFRKAFGTVSAEMETVLSEIKKAQDSLKSALKDLHETQQSFRTAEKEAKECNKKIAEFCPATQTKINPDIKPVNQGPEGRPFVTFIQWGYVTKTPTDSSALDWPGSVAIDRGEVSVTERVLFEDGDLVLEQSDPGAVHFKTATTTHWDGIMVKFNPEQGVGNNVVTINVGEFSKRYLLNDLLTVHERVTLDNGREVLINSMHRPLDVSEKKQNQLIDLKQKLLKKTEALQNRVKELMESAKITEALVDRLTGVLNNLTNYNYVESGEKALGQELSNLASGFTADSAEEDINSLQGSFERVKSQMRPEKFQSGLIPFTDVDDDQWFFEPVKFLKDNGIASGYAGSTDFGPGNSVTRAEVMKMSLEAAGADTDESGNGYFFGDAAGHWAKKYINYAFENGIVKGYGGEFRPDQSVTRAEALKMAGMAVGLPSTACTSSDFSDMEGHWARCIVQEAKDLGVVSGMPDGDFHPDEPITRAAFAKVMQKLVEVSQEEDYQGVDSGLASFYLK